MCYGIFVHYKKMYCCDWFTKELTGKSLGKIGFPGREKGRGRRNLYVWVTRDMPGDREQIGYTEVEKKLKKRRRRTLSNRSKLI